jgi:hypothetical protein
MKLFDAHGKETDIWDNSLHRGGRVTNYKIDYRGHNTHDTALVVREKFPQEFEAYFKFSFVRNPWAQMASFYWLRAEQGRPVGDFENFIFSKLKEIHSGHCSQSKPPR